MTATPNILCIVTDHQLHATLPPGLAPFALRRRLAELGTEFTRAYAVLPVCSPARASMLTGLYPHAHGLTENDGRFGGRAGLDPADWMLQRALRDGGYRCAWFGKWHVDNARSALDYGFEGFSLPGYGYPYATPEYRAYLARRGLAAPRAVIELPGESGRAAGSVVSLAERDRWFDYESGTALLDGPAVAHEAFFLADLAARWLERRDDAPFFLRLDTWGPHPPYLVGDVFADSLDATAIDLPPGFDNDLSARPRHHRDYRDYWQGRLGLDREGWLLMFRRALEQAAQVEQALAGLLDCVDLDDTLVIFTSDHGDALASNGAVANKGGLLAEATLRIPLLLAGPGVPRGRQRDGLASNLDLAPTVLDACGLETDRVLHGRSLLPLAADAAAPWREGLMSQHYGLHEPIAQRAWHAGDWKLVLQPDGFAEMYQLAEDPAELRNLARDPAYRGEFERLDAGLREALARHADPWTVAESIGSRRTAPRRP